WHVAEVVYVGQAQHFGELLAQADLHLVFGGINAVLGQAAGFDVAIEDDDFMPALSDFLRSEHSCWSGADHEHGLHTVLHTLRQRFQVHLHGTQRRQLSRGRSNPAFLCVNTSVFSRGLLADYYLSSGAACLENTIDRVSCGQADFASICAPKSESLGSCAMASSSWRVTRSSVSAALLNSTG